jgi:hypothetical protein
MTQRFPLCLLLLAAVAPAWADDGPVQAVLARCLDNPGGFTLNGETLAPPPGLARQGAVKVGRIAGNRLFEYVGTSPHEIACGIALYGPVAADVKSRLLEVLKSRKGEPGGSHPLSGGTATYWGSAEGRGLTGIVMTERPPSPDAPTLEVDFHATLTP